MKNVVITTYPFGIPNSTPINLLQTYNINFSLNQIGRKYSREEHHKILRETNPEAIIAGTEQYNVEALDLCPNLKIIARVGVGIDSVDLIACKNRGIVVTNGPETCTNAVAEITICQILNALRRVPQVSQNLKNLGWNRFIGREIRDCNIGIIGVGRIGSLVLEKLQSLKPRQIFINDIDPTKLIDRPRATSVSLSYLLNVSDVVTIHIPLDDNYHFIGTRELQMMKTDACILNYSRGGIIDENALLKHVQNNKEFQAVIDTFENEPYTGPFIHEDQIIITPHLGSCTTAARLKMETQAVEDIINFINHKTLHHRVV